jgi:hypothetical protein
MVKGIVGDASIIGHVVETFLEYLLDIDNYRGTGRLFLP